MIVQRFKIVETKQDDVTHFELTGCLDEDARFPLINAGVTKEIVFDLEGLTAVNSVGIRTWMAWSSGLVAKNVKMSFERIPAFIVFKFNLMKGFFPKGATVKSLYVAFSCDKCSKDVNVLADIRSHEAGDSIVDLAHLRAKECGKSDCQLEPEMEESKYLVFLNRK